MDVIFTTCTYNHISRAFSLSASIRKYVPQYRLIICLVDKLEQSIEIPDHCEVIEVSQLDIPGLDEMILKYSALELNSALKPFLAYALLKTYQFEQIIYLDSDIIIYQSFDYLENVSIKKSVVLSPHSLSTVSGDKGVDDRNFMRSGIYNAGFFLVKNNEDGLAFLDWWRTNLKDKCYIDSNRGMFAEQLWLNLAPLYFDYIYIDTNLGANVAYWNLHERRISFKEGKYFVNQTNPLIFFHFSGVSINALQVNSLSTHQSQYDFDSRPDVKPLYEEYIVLLKKFGHEDHSGYYTISKRLKTRNKFLIFVATNYKKIIKRLLFSK